MLINSNLKKVALSEPPVSHVYTLSHDKQEIIERTTSWKQIYDNVPFAYKSMKFLKDVFGRDYDCWVNAEDSFDHWASYTHGVFKIYEDEQNTFDAINTMSQMYFVRLF